MRPWLEQAERTGGRIYTNWNQVRQPEGGGARTGRLSSSPNFQNIPVKTSPNFERLVAALKKAKLLDVLEPFPMVRAYLAPDPGDVFLDRDYSQQELRILGHYEGAVLMTQYNENPWLDVHELARQLINGMLGTSFTRRPIKDTGFGLIYGMGLDKLARKIEHDKKVAKTIRDAYLSIFPGLGELDRQLKFRGRGGQPIRTWGGREYFVEPPVYSKKFGRLQTFEYKLLNVLIQGSAADNTKQAILNYDAHPKRRARFLLTVHDEFLASCPRGRVREEMRTLREAMESVAFDVPMLTEGEYGADWSNLKTFDEKGVELYKGR
jgi:DNA polymerase-1